MTTENTQAIIMVTRGSDLAIVARLDGSTVLIGREAPADLIIENHYVSRRHALVSPTKDGYTICDEGSKNGTAINGELIGKNPVRLENGDAISIAEGNVEMKFQSSSATATIKSGLLVDTNKSPGLHVDLESREITIDGAPVAPPLVGRQFALLSCLFDAAGRACSWDELAQSGWPDRSLNMVGRNEIIQLVHEVRKRLADHGLQDSITSVRGFGYRLET